MSRIQDVNKLAMTIYDKVEELIVDGYDMDNHIIVEFDEDNNLSIDSLPYTEDNLNTRVLGTLTMCEDGEERYADMDECKDFANTLIFIQ